MRYAHATRTAISYSKGNREQGTGNREQGAAMQRGLGGSPHERLHQDGSREQGTNILSIDLGLLYQLMRYAHATRTAYALRARYANSY
ncbi:MAG: hypothetical protein F6K26_55400 [Moorea sp. SIO2I5]|nr:hypothetical protein [Moorena sp. SIO2I5]